LSFTVTETNQELGSHALVFSYWTNAAQASPPAEGAHPLDAMVADWRAKYEDFRIFTDADILDLLADWSPTLPALFNRIRLPACRSDLARLILLYEYGGLYVDAHVGTASAERLTNVLERLSSKEFLLFDRIDQHQWDGDSHIVNYTIGARKHSAVLGKVIFAAIRNLERQEAAEAATTNYVPYNIFVLTGPWNISITLFDRSERNIRLLPEYQSLVHVETLDPQRQPWPFQPYQHYHYRKPGQHWSERQLVEPLFERRQASAADMCNQMFPLQPEAITRVADQAALPVDTCDPEVRDYSTELAPQTIATHDLLRVFSGVVDRTANSGIEPFFEEYRETLEELNLLAISTGENIEGSLFNAHMVREMPFIPPEAYRHHRRNYVKYAASGSRLLEIGFNAGHAALLGLTANPYLTYTGIDSGRNRYSHLCYEFLKKKFASRIRVLIGDLPELLSRMESGTFDLIHVGGRHLTDPNRPDLASLIKVANVNSHILFNDVSAEYVASVISFYVLTGHLGWEQLPGLWEHSRPGVMRDQILLRVCKIL
jgi:hypothetical protein